MNKISCPFHEEWPDAITGEMVKNDIVPGMLSLEYWRRLPSPQKKAWWIDFWADRIWLYILVINLGLKLEDFDRLENRQKIFRSLSPYDKVRLYEFLGISGQSTLSFDTLDYLVKEHVFAEMKIPEMRLFRDNGWY